MGKPKLQLSSAKFSSAQLAKQWQAEAAGTLHATMTTCHCSLASLTVQHHRTNHVHCPMQSPVGSVPLPPVPALMETMHMSIVHASILMALLLASFMPAHIESMSMSMENLPQTMLVPLVSIPTPILMSMP